MALIIDTTRCQGHGRCVLINPKVFEMDDDGYGVVLDPEPAGDARADADRAIGNCPEQAISWTASLSTYRLVDLLTRRLTDSSIYRLAYRLAYRVPEEFSCPPQPIDS